MTYDEWKKLDYVEKFIDDLTEDEGPIVMLARLEKFCFEEGQKYPSKDEKNPDKLYLKEIPGMGKNTPSESGLYLARSDEKFRWYNIIVNIYGDPPFLRWQAWDRAHDRILKDTGKPPFFFGPKIEFDPTKGE